MGRSAQPRPVLRLEADEYGVSTYVKRQSHSRPAASASSPRPFSCSARASRSRPAAKADGARSGAGPAGQGRQGRGRAPPTRQHRPLRLGQGAHRSGARLPRPRQDRRAAGQCRRPCRRRARCSPASTPTISISRSATPKPPSTRPRPGTTSPRGRSSATRRSSPRASSPSRCSTSGSWNSTRRAPRSTAAISTRDQARQPGRPTPSSRPMPPASSPRSAPRSARWSAPAPPVVVVARDGDKEVAIAVPENEIRHFAVGDKLAARFWADDAIALTGTVREVSGSADSTSRTFAVRVSLPEDARDPARHDRDAVRRCPGRRRRDRRAARRPRTSGTASRSSGSSIRRSQTVVPRTVATAVLCRRTACASREGLAAGDLVVTAGHPVHDARQEGPHRRCDAPAAIRGDHRRPLNIPSHPRT